MFSVLMSVYHRESPDALRSALDSLVNQSVAPAEVVLIKDGPLSNEMEDVIKSSKLRLPMTIHALPENRGLAHALNVGLEIAGQPWIMRFDSDDVCLPNRVEVQAGIVEDCDVVLMGAQIEEFQFDHNRPIRTREVPCDHQDILRRGLLRNPFNHMTVCYKRDLVVKLGGYPAIPFMEDYALWMKMLADGAKSMNSPDVLVRARVGNGMIGRRGGFKYIRSEWMLQRLLVKLGLKSHPAALRDGTLRSAVFLSPHSVRTLIYSKKLRGYSKANSNSLDITKNENYKG